MVRSLRRFALGCAFFALNSVAAAEPGDHVNWLRYSARRASVDRGWGPVLTDLDRHLDPRHGDYFRHKDPVTHGHETSHGITSDLHEGRSAQLTGFYCLDDRVAILSEPALRLTQVAAEVPEAVRGPLFAPYVENETWDDRPTYLLDEWNAYLNGAAVWRDQRLHGLATREADALFGPREFAAYALALCVAVERHDPGYLDGPDGRQFREFIAFCLRRCSALCGGRLISESEETRVLVNLAERWYGRSFCSRYVLGTARPTTGASAKPTARARPAGDSDSSAYNDVYDRAVREHVPLLVQVGDCPAALLKQVRDEYPRALEVIRKSFPGVVGPCVVVSEPRDGWLEWTSTRWPD